MAENPRINLLNKALDVIELLAAESREMGVSEISRRLGLVKSGTFRILATLRERDFIFQNPVTKNYGLGLKFFFVGSSVQTQLPICVLSRAVLEPLSLEYRQNVRLAIPYLSSSKSAEQILVYVSSCSEGLSPPVNPGIISPCNASASGQCILAHMSESELEGYLRCPLRKLTAKTEDSWDRLIRELELIRDRGYAVCDGTWENGLMDIAVPLFDSMHYSIGAVSICGESRRMKSYDRSLMVRKLRMASSRISGGL